MDFGRRGLLQAAGAGLLSSVAFGNSAHAALAGTIKVGVIQPAQGTCAQWGLPIIRAVEMWGAEAAGTDGFLAGDGKRYGITVNTYDNICYAAGDELLAARRAVLNDDVHFLLQTYTPSCREAIGPLTNDSKTLAVSYGAGYLSKTFPYLLGGQTGAPTANMLTIAYLIEKHPNLKRIAIITGDTSFGKAARAYVQAGIAAQGGSATIVYDTSYGATATNDMLGLLTPLAESNPDIIYELGFTPGQKATMLTTMEQLGFKGIYGSESWEVGFLKEAGVLDAVAGRLYSGPAIDAQEPSFSPRAHLFYQEFVKKYGIGQWSAWASASYAAMVILEVGWKASPSVDPTQTMMTLYGTETIDHPIFGPSKWGGEEIFGVNHHLLTPQPVYGVTKDGVPILDGVVATHDWWEKNKAAALPKLKAAGQVYTG